MSDGGLAGLSGNPEGAAATVHAMKRPTPLPNPSPSAKPGRIARFLGSPGSSKRVLARNAIWNALTFLAHALAAFFLSPLLVRALGDGLYGYWEVAVSILGYFGLGDLGVRPAIVHFAAQADAREDAGELNRFVNSAFVTLAVLAAAILLIAGPLSPFVPGWFGVESGFVSEAAWAFFLMVIMFAVTLPMNAITAVVIAKQRYDRTCQVDFIIVLLRTAGIVWVLQAGHGLVALALVHLATELIEMIWKMAIAFRLEPKLAFRPKVASRAHARRLLGYGGLSFIIAIAMHLSQQTDAIVIGTIGMLEQVTFFALAAKLLGYTRGLMVSMGRVLRPAISAIDAGDPDAPRTLAKLLTGSARALLVLSVPMVVYWIVMGGAFLEQWQGKALYRQEGTPVILGLIGGVFIHVSSDALVAWHYGTGRLKALAHFAAWEGLLNLALSIALYPWLGILGVALGTTLPAVIIHGVLMPRLVCRELDFRLSEWFVRVWSLPLLVGALVAAASLLLLDPAASYGWVPLFGAAGAMAIVGWGIAMKLRVKDAPEASAEAAGE